MAILSKENEDGKLNIKNQRIKVISTKIPVDQSDSINLLAEYLFKTGVIETSTPSALLRNSITQLLNSYHDDIESYHITKKQGTANNSGHQLGNIEKNQILGNDHVHPSVNNDIRAYPQDMNRTFVKETEYRQEEVLSMSNKKHESSHFHITQEELKDPQEETQFLGNNEQHGVEDPITNLYKLDMFKYMYTLVMIDRPTKIKTVYLEVDEATKEVIHLVPSYGLENWKKMRKNTKG